MKNNAMITIFALLGGLLAGCATGYVRSKGSSYGYSETKLKDGVYRVSFRGNGSVSMEEVEEMLLLRSAEVALENGYDYFQIVKNPLLETVGSGAATTETADGVYYDDKYVINDHCRNKTMPFDTCIPKSFRQHRINCFKEKPQNADPIYDASKTKATLKSKYAGK